LKKYVRVDEASHSEGKKHDRSKDINDVNRQNVKCSNLERVFHEKILQYKNLKKKKGTGTQPTANEVTHDYLK